MSQRTSQIRIHSGPDRRIMSGPPSRANLKMGASAMRPPFIRGFGRFQEEQGATHPSPISLTLHALAMKGGYRNSGKVSFSPHGSSILESENRNTFGMNSPRRSLFFPGGWAISDSPCWMQSRLKSVLRLCLCQQVRPPQSAPSVTALASRDMASIWFSLLRHREFRLLHWILRKPTKDSPARWPASLRPGAPRRRSGVLQQQRLPSSENRPPSGSRVQMDTRVVRLRRYYCLGNGHQLPHCAYRAPWQLPSYMYAAGHARTTR